MGDRGRCRARDRERREQQQLDDRDVRRDSDAVHRNRDGYHDVDVDEWPTPDGSYPIYCDADRRPDQQSLVTHGSVYDRG